MSSRPAGVANPVIGNGEARARMGFVEHLLLGALGAPGASGLPLASRLVADLFGILAVEGEANAVGRYLAPHPDLPATFEVRSGRDAGAGAAPGQSGLDAAAALREAARLANGGSEVVEVVSVAGSLKRLVLERTAPEPMRFNFPDAAFYEGERDEVAAAVSRWDRFLDPRSGSEPEAAVAEAVRDALRDVTVEVDLGAVEQVVADAFRVTLSEWDRSIRERSDTEGERVAAAVVPRVVLALGDRLAALQPPAPKPLPPTPPPRPEPAPAPDTSGVWLAQASLASASEQLHLHLVAFSDRVRAGSRALEALADELNSRERTAAAHTDRLAQSMSASVDRLGRRIEARLDDLAPEVAAPATADLRRLLDALAAVVDRLDAATHPSAHAEDVTLP